MTASETEVPAAEIEAIVGGYHGDAFHVLGPHRVLNGLKGAKSKAVWEVRAFLPQAKSARWLRARAMRRP